MIVLTYAAGTTGLAKVGALVRQASSVESLAQVSVVCFSQAGILTGTQVEVEIIEPLAGCEQLTESRIRQIVGDYAHNTSVNNLATQAMIASFDGARRTVREEAPFLSMYGWTGIAFDDADLKGVYILGEPQVLKTCLAADDEADEEQANFEQEPASWRRAIAPLGYFFRRSEPDAKEINVKQAPGPEPENKTEAVNSRLPKAAPQTEAALLTPSFFQRLSEPINRLLRPGDALPPDELENPAGKSTPNIFRRLTGRVGRILRPEEAAQVDENSNQAAGKETALMFAYYPELTPLHSTKGLPQLPDGLIPLCKLRYTEQVHPEALDTIRTFFEAGVGIKVFTAHSPERTKTILEQTELGKGEEMPLRVVTGPELSEMDAGQLAQVVAEGTVFGQITPEQAGLVVESLQEQGESVAVVGDKVTDLPAMQHANLTIARRSSSQITLSVADIILLNDSPRVLQTVIDKGQRIANGLLDVLKLNLTQVFYLALLIVGIRMAAAGFPFQPKQGMVINLLTLTIPSMALSLWAKAGVLPGASMNWLLARFVAPAAITMGAVATIVYRIFLERTGEVAYAQLTLTYTLVIAGLLLVLFVKSPEHLGRAGAILSGDKRFLLLVLGLLVLFTILVTVPLTQEFFELALLRQPTDYLIVGAASFAWAITMRLIWLIKPLQWKK
jgi:magnesium-transporting ATPase (P-type)